jgi:hypothetical protein
MNIYKKADPKAAGLCKLLYANKVTCTRVDQSIGLPQFSTNRLVNGKYSMDGLNLLVKLANYFGVSIFDVYEIPSNADNDNKLRFQVIQSIMADIKTLSKIKRTFTRNEQMYLAEMLKDKVFNNPGLPRHFLINTILEADYYSNISVKHKVRAQELADKVESLIEMEAFILLDKIIKYNRNNETNIDLLFK